MGLVSTTFLASKDRVIVTVRGECLAADLLDTGDRLYDDPQFRTGMSTVLDLRGAIPAVTADNIRTIVSFISRNLERRGRGRCAVVVERDVDYGMARMGQAYLDEVGVELGVFRDLAAAERWLDGEAIHEGLRSPGSADDEPEIAPE
jgi:hypothetical protein